MDDAAAPLPTTLAECHAKIAELADANATLQAAKAQQQATIAEQQVTIDEQQTLLRALQRDIALLKRTLFGQRRERFEDPRQGLLFDAVAVGGGEPDAPPAEDDQHAALADEDGASHETDGQKSSRRNGRGRRVIPEGLPRVKRIHELDAAEIPEHLRDDAGRRFLKKVGEYVEWEPPRLMVIEEFVETLAVDNADATETAMVSAPRPPRILTCFAGPSLLAGLAAHHFADHLPYYRLEEILGRSRLVIDRSTQCRWMIRLAKELTPLTDLMRRLALDSPVALADETPVKMLVPGQGKTSTTYLWAILGDRQHPYTTFSFTESRARAGPAEFFADFEGILVSDAYIGYEFLHPHSQGRILLAGCHAHARRKFEELHALGPTERTATAMGYFQRLFDIEDELRDVSDEARHEQRQLRSRPLLAEFKRWMDEQLETLRPKHDLRGAIQYMTSRWECFERFLTSGSIPLDNNASEQAVKNPVMGKKAWLFFGSPAGGHAAAVFYTLTATCRRLRIDPYAYLRDVFERLPQLRCNSRDPEDSTWLLPLLPDRWLVEHPQSELPMRTRESNAKSARRRTRRTQRRRALARAQRKNR
jgi:transposase